MISHGFKSVFFCDIPVKSTRPTSRHGEKNTLWMGSWVILSLAALEQINKWWAFTSPNKTISNKCYKKHVKTRNVYWIGLNHHLHPLHPLHIKNLPYPNNRKTSNGFNMFLHQNSSTRLNNNTSTSHSAVIGVWFCLDWGSPPFVDLFGTRPATFDFIYVKVAANSSINKQNATNLCATFQVNPSKRFLHTPSVHSPGFWRHSRIPARNYGWMGRLPRNQRYSEIFTRKVIWCLWEFHVDQINESMILDASLSWNWATPCYHWFDRRGVIAHGKSWHVMAHYKFFQSVITKFVDV